MMLAAMVMLSAASTPTAPLEQGWQFRWGDDLSWATAAWSAAEGWSDYRIPGNPPERSKGERWLWLRVRVPEGDWREPALKLDGVIGHWELFLDGQKLAQHPREDGLEAKGAHGMPWHLINLPPGAAGKILTIRSRTSYFLAGVVGRASVGERSVLIEDVVRADVPRAVVGALMVVIGLLALLILAPAGVRLARGFALFSVGAGLYTLNYTQLKQLAFDVPANLWFLAWCFSVAVMPIGTATYLAEVFHPEPPMLRRARQVQTFLGLVYGVTVLSAWAALTLWGSAVEPASTAAFVAVGGAVRLSMVVGSVLVVWLLITRSHRARGEERTQARILLLGLRVMTRSPAGVWIRAAFAVDGDPNIGDYFAAQRYTFSVAPDGVLWLAQDVPCVLHRFGASVVRYEVPNPMPGSGNEFGRYPALSFSASGKPQLLGRWRDTNNGGRKLFYVRFE